MRGIAVLAVVLYHAGVPGISGGFVGVDVFFVVSGFLITGLLWREVLDTGTVRLGRFYGNRARRLLPAAMTVLVVVAGVSAWALPPLRVPTVLRDALASAAYVGNYRLAVRGTDYLNAHAPPSPFQHYWSLGVEEQFYLVWPVLLVATAGAARLVGASLPRRSVNRSRSSHPAATPPLVALVMVAGSSFALSLVWTHTQPSWAFFSLPTRAWELALGGLVALTATVWPRLPRPLSLVTGWVGLALILAGCLRLNATTPYPGVAALLPALGAALIITAGCAAPRKAAGAVLSLPPVRLVGRYSYAWYLWHWPVLLLTPIVVGHALSLDARLAAATASLALAVLTTHIIEDPIRFAAPLRHSALRSLITGAATTAVGALMSLVLLLVIPAPVGHGSAAATPRIGLPSAAGGARTVEDPAQAAERTVQALTAQVQDILATSATAQAVPSNLTPPLQNAAADTPAPWTDGCLLTWTAVSEPPCVSGDPTSSTTIALVGDSHAAQWYAALDGIAQQRHWRLETLTKVVCPLLDLPIHSPHLGREYTECEQWRSEVLDRLRAQPPTVVVLDMRRFYTNRAFHFSTYSQQWLDSLTSTVVRLRSLGSMVLVLGPVPEPGTNVPSCLSEHLSSAPACNPHRVDALNSAGIAAEQEQPQPAAVSTPTSHPCFAPPPNALSSSPATWFSSTTTI